MLGGLLYPGLHLGPIQLPKDTLHWSHRKEELLAPLPGEHLPGEHPPDAWGTDRVGLESTPKAPHRYASLFSIDVLFFE